MPQGLAGVEQSGRPGVVIPTGGGQKLFGGFEAVDGPEGVGPVGEDHRVFTDMGAERTKLAGEIVAVRVGEEPAIVEPLAGVPRSIAAVEGEFDFIPRGVAMGPEGG